MLSFACIAKFIHKSFSDNRKIFLKMLDIFTSTNIMRFNNIGKAKTERVVCRKHPERRTFGGSPL
jgi:hypothetical protein